MSKFNELNLSPEILRAVDEMGYESATQIQSETIPLIMDGRDVLGRSNTGTGKTAAFGIPAIERIDTNNRMPQVLIICPTRELVTQVASELRKFSKYKEGVKIVPIYGGQPIDGQIRLLKRGCGIVVGTPGRIMDHLKRKTLKFTDTKMVILDEADEMLNMGFKEDIEEILKSMPADGSHQTILFSATMPAAIMKITKQFQDNPALVEIKSATRTIDTVTQLYFDIPRGKKTNSLRVLLQHYDPDLTMIFCNTKKMVDELTDELNACGLKSIGLHGDMKQSIRTRVMEQFKNGNYPILIATDVAARGIDVDNIELVVNYDIPQDNEYYIHRVGRTGRAGREGKAITLVTGRKQQDFIREIMHYTKTNIRKHVLPTNAQMMEHKRKEFMEQVKLACNDQTSREHQEITNELLSEGLAIENLVAALISLSYKPEVIDVEEVPGKNKMDRDFETTTLKFNIGIRDNVQPGHIVCAIAEETGLSSAVIGKIDVRTYFSLVGIASDYAQKVMDTMQNATIRGKEMEVSFDSKPKRREGGESRSRSRDDRPRGDRGRRDGGHSRDKRSDDNKRRSSRDHKSSSDSKDRGRRS
ncbi:MAG: DEAD/DEAH box helicase [Erysipelotrichaceae bacterium]